MMPDPTDIKYYTLTDEEAKTLPDRILAILLDNRKTGKRVTAKQLARQFGYTDDRKIRVAIGKLVLKGHVIVSSVRGSKGFYFAETQDDVDAYVKTQFSRVRETYAHIRQVQKNAEHRFGPQLPLVLDLAEIEQ